MARNVTLTVLPATTMDAGDLLATEAFIQDMYAEFDKEYDAIEAEIGAPNSGNLQRYRDGLSFTSKMIREANLSLVNETLPW